MVITRQDALTYHCKFFSIIFENSLYFHFGTWDATILLPNGDVVRTVEDIKDSEVKTVRDQLILDTYIRLDV